MGRLYIKIFLSFLGILVMTLLLTFAMFIHFPGKYFQDRFQHYAKGHCTVIKSFLEEKIQSGSRSSESDARIIEAFTSKMGEIYGAKFWVTDSTGKILVKSFEGDVPKESDRQIHMEMDPETGEFDMKRGLRRKHGLYMRVPVQTGEEKAPLYLHSLFETVSSTRHKAGFALGLLVIGTFVALLVIPVTRLITRRLNRLKESAILFSNGDLSHRTRLCGKDEVAQLASTFNRMAAKLERMIQGGKELTANVSHELRSPLARMRVAEEMLRARLKKENAHGTEKYLDDIRREIHELDRLIGRILEFSKLDLHEETPETVSIDLSALVQKQVKRFETLMQKKKVVFESEVPVSLQTLGHERGLESAIGNLLDNAVKFVPEKGRIAVRLSQKSDCLELRVSNTCPALSKEALENLFEPFYRVADANAAGTGLGLSITRKIIERHGGSIRAANSKDGIELTVRLPEASCISTGPLGIHEKLKQGGGDDANR